MLVSRELARNLARNGQRVYAVARRVGRLRRGAFLSASATLRGRQLLLRGEGRLRRDRAVDARGARAAAAGAGAAARRAARAWHRVLRGRRERAAAFACSSRSFAHARRDRAPAAASKPPHGAGGGTPCPRAAALRGQRRRALQRRRVPGRAVARRADAWRGTASSRARERSWMLAVAPSPGARHLGRVAARLRPRVAGLASAILISQRQLLRQFHGDDAHAAVWEGPREGPADDHDAADRGSRDS